MSKKHLLYLLMLTLLSGCDTVYQPLQWDGGYTDKQLAAEHYWIKYLGNTTTSVTWVSRSWHRRAAQLCPNGYRQLKIKVTSVDTLEKKPILETPLTRVNPTLEGEVICH